MNPFRATTTALRWLAGEAWEKINIVATWRELKELGRKHGKRFFIAAVAWEIIEDVVFPILSWRAGVPELIPVFLVLHFEPITYPIFFWCFKMWDRFQGREPWDPNRSAASTYTRTTAKAFSYRALSLGLFFLILAQGNIGLGILAAYTVLMSCFAFVHDRIWHDSNYGIDENDQVHAKRVVAKVASYRMVSTLVMAGLFYGLHLDMGLVALYQGIMLAVHLLHEGVWAKVAWGIRPTA